MATISVTVPDGLIADVAAALRAHYTEAVSGMTNPQVGEYHIRESIRPILKAYRKRAAAATVAASEEAARVAAEAALATERQARLDAEAAAIAQADADADRIT